MNRQHVQPYILCMFNGTLKNISVCACIWESVFMFLETSQKKLDIQLREYESLLEITLNQVRSKSTDQNAKLFRKFFCLYSMPEGE